jgi:hypothetical protein
MNDNTSLEAMQSYNGTELVKSDSDFAIWYCTDLSSNDIDAITGYSGPAKGRLVGLMVLNVPQQETL